MEIRNPCVVSLTWKLSDAQNRPLDELAEPVEFFYGGDDLLAKVEDALAGHESGDDLQLHLEPEDAFGDYRPELVCFEERKLFAEPVEAGMAYEGLPKGHATPDMPADAVYIVTEVYPSHVVLDGNHPLAGMALRLHITVRAVREATDHELEAKSVGESTITVLGSAPGKPGRQTLH
ncbi:MAG: peptidylprolyl isomerase [Betaproteobacteria bacterium]|nr:peptidylprolyl isomerase [Betaproteobacteria bacterium]MCC6250085.1 peptidylprolyl isomerase [Rubrivivax sp.]MCL4699373.1 peptidylprolyl isomerase [Burkholderiaceae bacterium]